MKTTFSANTPVAAEPSFVTRWTCEPIHQPPPHVLGHVCWLRRSARRVLLLLAVAALSTQAALAAKPGSNPPPPLENWLTVDDIQDANNYALTVTPNGDLFAAGYGGSAQGYGGLIRTSADGGNNWSPLYSFLYPGLNTTIYSAIASDSVGNLYVSGIAWDDGSDDGGPAHWIVQRSTNGGATWSLVDDFVPGGSWWLFENTAIAVDAAGNVFFGCPANGGVGSLNTYWTIRKGIGGTSFTTVDILPYPSDYGPQGLYAHPTAGIFAVGDDRVVVTNKNDSTSSSRAWIVRRSLDGGATWQTVDKFQLSNGYLASAIGVGADTVGNLYAVGRAIGPFVKGTAWAHWVVRKSANGGNAWTTVDDYQLDPNNYSMAHRFVASANGNLYVAGFGALGSNNGTGYNYHWIVRKNVGGTGTWKTVDDFQYGGAGSTPNAIAADGFGKVFVGGYGGSHWLTRRSP